MPIFALMMVCAAALVVWVYHQDRFEKEPWWAVIVALACGFGMMWVLGQADDFAIPFFHLSRDRVFTKAATIALIEEGGKLLTVLLLAHVILRNQFNDPMDGLIYGRLAGLGMAVEESLLYLSLAPATLQTLGIEIVRLFGHSLMGGIVGFAIGLGAQPRGRREYHPRLVLLCLALSTTLHFAWNVVAYTRSPQLWARVLPMGLMLLMMVTWRWFCAIAEARSRHVFAYGTSSETSRPESRR
jgi:RsiW-degrading membrane proteinase PrsW (M82 family)